MWKFIPAKSTPRPLPELLAAREGGREAEGGGLLNLPALFALADFHLFSVIYAALSCAAMSTFAGYSAPRVHQEFVIAIRPRSGLERSHPAADATREVVERWLLDVLM